MYPEILFIALLILALLFLAFLVAIFNPRACQNMNNTSALWEYRTKMVKINFTIDIFLKFNLGLMLSSSICTGAPVSPNKLLIKNPAMVHHVVYAPGVLKRSKHRGFVGV